MEQDGLVQKRDTLKGLLERAKNLVARKTRLIAEYRKRREDAKIQELKEYVQTVHTYENN